MRLFIYSVVIYIILFPIYKVSRFQTYIFEILIDPVNEGSEDSQAIAIRYVCLNKPSVSTAERHTLKQEKLLSHKLQP